MKKYKIIYADPPWSFNNKKTGGSMKSGAGSHYSTMSLEEICSLPVKDITDDDCVLVMWWVGSQPIEALKVVEAWGFKIKTMTGFNWVKTTEDKQRNKRIDSLINILSTGLKTNSFNILVEALRAFKMRLDFGMGFWTRAGSECALIAVKGKPKRVKANIRSVIMAKKLKHSQKPSEVRDRVVSLCGDVPRLEMFAREPAFGWDSFGDEVNNSIIWHNLRD